MVSKFNAVFTSDKVAQEYLDCGRIVFVVGYPRSGTNLLAWIAGDVLNSPVTSVGNESVPEYGGSRRGDHIVVHGHSVPVHLGDGFFSRNIKILNSDNIGKSKILFITRDPREIVVSTARYFNISTQDAVAILSGFPVSHSIIGNWSGYVRKWLGFSGVSLHVHYSDLVNNCAREVRKIATLFGTEVDAEKVRSRWSIAACKERFKAEKKWIPETYFGNGETGAWAKSLPRDLARKIEIDHGNVMRQLEYL